MDCFIHVRGVMHTVEPEVRDYVRSLERELKLRRQATADSYPDFAALKEDVQVLKEMVSKLLDPGIGVEFIGNVDDPNQIELQLNDLNK